MRRLVDEIQHHRLPRELAARLRRLCASNPIDLTRAYELTETPDLQRQISQQLWCSGAFEQPELWLRHAAEGPRYQAAYRNKREIGRSIVLKAPGPGGERGVLLLTFEYNWAKLMLGLDAAGRKWLDQHYHLILSTSWSPTDYSMLAMMLACSSQRLWVQSCNPAEIAAIEAFHPRLSCLRTMPCDWLDPDTIEPLDAHQRDIDLLMVANWGDFKRHWEFFHTLRQLPAQWRIVLVGQHAQGRHVPYVKDLARHYQVPQPLDIHEGIPISEVAALQARSKVAVILSRREGCCVAAVEAMMAGSALAMRSDAHIGPRAHINPQTGALLRPGHLAADLLALHSRHQALNPRSWCLQQACNRHSLKQLERQLQGHDLGMGRPWTRGLALPMWKPHPIFADIQEQQQLKPAYEELSQRFPELFTLKLWAQRWD